MSDLAIIQASWDRAAVQDAMFNIITDPARVHGGWTAEEFFAHGQVEIDAAMERLKGLGLSEGHGLALDFGCGVGRLTQALAAYYDRVHGVDISREMINLANKYNTLFEGIVKYHANSRPDLRLFADDAFDLVYSMIVLQHMPQDMQHGYVSEFFRVRKPDGVAMFEIPDGPDEGHPGWHLSMHGVQRSTVERWIAGAGGNLVDVEDLGKGDQWQCYRYTATRKALR